MRLAAYFNDLIVIEGSTPLSNLNDASELIEWFFALFLTEIWSKRADSKKIDLVPELTDDSIPPITPAIHIGFLSLQISKSSLLRSLLISSSVTIFSPLLAFLTIIFFPLILL